MPSRHMRAYLDGTILRTVLTTATGKIAITDYMLAAAPLQPSTIM